MLKKLLVLPIMLIGLVAMNTVDLSAQEVLTYQNYDDSITQLPSDLSDYSISETGGGTSNNEAYSTTTYTKYNVEREVYEMYIKNTQDVDGLDSLTLRITNTNQGIDVRPGNFTDVQYIIGPFTIPVVTSGTDYLYLEINANDVLRDDYYFIGSLRDDYPTRQLEIVNMPPILTIPTATISNVQTTYDSITFDYDISDPDGALITDGASYTVDGQTTTLSSLTGTEIVTGLLSDTSYSIDLNLSYDTGDGTGTQTDTVTETVTTTALSPPSVSITNISTTFDTITFDYAISDPDNTLSSGGYTIGSNTYDFPDTSGTITETNLDMDTTYEIHAELFYNLNDGGGIRSYDAYETASTDPPDVPENLVRLIDLIPVIYAFAMIAGIGIYVKFGGQDQDFKTKVLEVFLMLVIGLALLPVIHLVIQNIYG